MTFTRRKKTPEGAAKPEVKTHLVSVSLTNEEYTNAVKTADITCIRLY